MELRPYQQEAVDAVYRHLREHDDNPCVVIPTAGGKTPVLATICKDAVVHWDGRVLVLAHVKELLEQAADKLQADLPRAASSASTRPACKRRDTEHPVIVAGIQSVYKRACELDAFDLIIVDEAHLIPPDGDGMYRQFLADAKVVNPQVRTIGLTATPFRLKSGMICAAGPHPQPDLLRGRRPGTDPRRLPLPAGHQGRARRRPTPAACTSAAASSWPTRSKT